MKLNSNITNLLKLITVILLIIFGNFLFGYKFRSIFTLLISWIIIPFATLVICSCKWPKYFKSILAALLLVLDYFLLKIFMLSTDVHDGNLDDANLGLAMVTASFIITIFVTIVTLFICFKSESIKEFKKTLIPFIVIIISTSLYYYDFGVVRNIKPSANIIQSKKQKVFVSKYLISDKIVQIKNDNFYLKEAWLEKQMRLNHRGIFRKVNPTGKYYLLIRKDHNVQNWGYSNKYKYYINGNLKTSKFLFPKGPFKFISDSIQNELTITLKRLDKDSVQFKVTSSQ